MVDRMVRRLPVVDGQRRLVGSVSRADLCWGLICLGHRRLA
jgi:CBS domain-containing protein